MTFLWEFDLFDLEGMPTASPLAHHGNSKERYYSKVVRSPSDGASISINFLSYPFRE